MPAPTITALPPAPVRGDAPATFSAAANTFVAALPGLVTESNALGTYLDGVGTAADADAVAAAASAAAALVSENNAATSETNAALSETNAQVFAAAAQAAAGIPTLTGNAGNVLTVNGTADGVEWLPLDLFKLAISNWVERETPNDYQWGGGNGAIAFSPSLPIVVCVATGAASTSSVMTSREGTTWATRTAPNTNSWTGVAWSESLGIFAVVGSSGTGNRAMSSPDGISWTARTSAADSTWAQVIWSETANLFIAIASTASAGQYCMTSANGTSWTIRAGMPSQTWNSLADNGSIIVAVASSGTGDRVVTSTDGVTWTHRVSAADNSWVRVVWAEGLGLFVAISSSGTTTDVMTSPDGINWTAQTTPLLGLWNLAYSEDYGVLVATMLTASSSFVAKAVYSTDGLTWNLLPASITTRTMRSLLWVKEMGCFIATLSSGTGNRVLTSLYNVAASE